MPNFVVTSLSDVSANDGVTTLREALSLANANPDADTITFDAGLTGGTLTLAQGTLYATEAVTIDGDIDGNGTPDITVNRNGADWGIQADGNGADITFNGLTVTGSGFSGIYSFNSNTTIRNSVLTGNGQSGRYGGGAGAYGGSLTIENTTITDNRMDSYFPSSGGGVAALNADLTIRNSSITNNFAYYGGGIYANSNSPVTIEDTNISGNSAGYGGGGGWLTNATIKRTTVDNNDAGAGAGGGLILDNSTIENSTISNNSTGFYGQYGLIGPIGGGGINGNGNILRNVTVAGNYDFQVGGIDGDFTGFNVTITNNGGYYAGGIWGGANTKLYNSIVLGNRSYGVYVGGEDEIYTAVGVSSNSITSSNSVETSPTSIFELVPGSPTPNLADNGGPVKTIALQDTATNGALDIGPVVGGLTTDARGLPRNVDIGPDNGGTVDAGAFELQGPPAADVVNVYSDASFTTLVASFTSLAAALQAALPGAGIDVTDPLAVGDAGAQVITTENLTIRGDAPFTASFSLAAGIADFAIQGTTPAHITSNVAANTLLGSQGANVILGNSGNDTILAGGGDDSIDGGSGQDSIDAGDGNDTVDGSAGADVAILGGAGSDSLIGGGGDDTLDGGDDADILRGGNNNDVLIGGGGNDSLRGDPGKDLIIGGDGNDAAAGGGGNDTIRGGDGNDNLLGLGGADLIFGNAGDDYLSGFASADSLFGGMGNDTLFGGAFNDDLTGGKGNDALSGDSGNDTLDGGKGNDSISGGSGSDALFGGSGNDSLDGGIGADIVVGNAGNDVLLGGNANDTIDGGAGADVIDGGAGSDLIIIKAGDGGDTILGGAGADTFDFESGFATSIINDMTIGQDAIDLVDVTTANAFGDLAITYFGGGTGADIDLGGGDVITVDGLTAPLSASDFIF